MAGGIFGGMIPSTPSTQAGAVQAYQPTQYTPSDWLALLGAAAHQISNGGDDIAQAQQTIAGRSLAMRQMQAQQSLTGLFSPGGGQPGASGAFDLDAAIPRLAAAQAAGINTTPYLEMLKAVKPNVQVANGVAYDPGKTLPGQRIGVNLQNVNNVLTDTQDPNNANRTIPQVDKGQVASFDAAGRPNGVQNLPGAVGAAAEMAGGVTGAQEGAKAGLDIVSIPMADGTARSMPRSVAAYLFGEGHGLVPGLGVTQSPAQTEAAKMQTGAQTQAGIDLPQTMANSGTVLSTIEALRKSPALGQRTGLYGVLPAIPGTPGADFDASLDQLKGKLFLEAYAGLKGGGQITEVEGKKATDALARLSTHQTPEAFKTALDDLEGVVRTGMQRAKTKAAGAQQGAGVSQISRDAAIAELKRRGKWPGA